MPSPVQPFLSGGGTYTLAVSTGPVPVQVSTNYEQGYLLSNLSTVNMQVLVAQSSATTLSTLSTGGLVAGIVLNGNQQITVSGPPNAWVSAMTTATTLTGTLAVSVGMGLI